MHLEGESTKSGCGARERESSMEKCKAEKGIHSSWHLSDAKSGTLRAHTRTQRQRRKSFSQKKKSNWAQIFLWRFIISLGIVWCDLGYWVLGVVLETAWQYL